MQRTDYLLLGTFFTLDSQVQELDQLHLQVRLNSRHALYEGHFPSRPVVPGVCVLGMVKDVLQHHLSQRLLLRTCTSGKFLRPIDPFTMATLDLTVQYTPRNLLLDFVASIQHERHVLCRVMGCFQPYAT